MNYSLIYLFSVLLMMTLVANNYAQLVMSWGFSVDGDKGLMQSLGLEDTTENRLKVLNGILFASVILAPLTLIYLLAGKLAK